MSTCTESTCREPTFLVHLINLNLANISILQDVFTLFYKFHCKLQPLFKTTMNGVCQGERGTLACTVHSSIVNQLILVNGTVTGQ